MEDKFFDNIPEQIRAELSLLITNYQLTCFFLFIFDMLQTA
jgi:hypothetical protein